MKEPFLDQLARPQPNPGGGAASAYAGSVAIALLEKIARLEAGRSSKSKEERQIWNELLEGISTLSEAFSVLRDEDVQAYMALATGRAEGRHGQSLLPALRQAVECPKQIVERGQEALRLAARAGARCRKHLISDLQVACELLSAAIHGAYHIGKANRFLAAAGPDRDSLMAPLQEAYAKAIEAIEEARLELLDRLG